MELYLIRHPRPDVAAGVCYGQLDVDLAEPAGAVAERLRPLLPARYELHASPLRRARALADTLGEARCDARLCEIHFGEWEGRSFADIGAAIDAWAADPMGFRAPGGESATEMAARANAWLAEHLARKPELPLVVVAHGGPLRAIAGGLLGVPAERWLALDFACGHATRIDIHDWGVQLRWFNR